MIKSELYKKDSYLNKNIPYLFNQQITEYDMSEAGYSLIREFKLLPKDQIQKLKEVGKKQRTYNIGLLQRNNEKLKKDMVSAFIYARQMFFDANDLEDNDIITVKKDAIITTKICTKTKMGEYINFRPKHFYTSYILLSRPKKVIELYYSPNDFAVKGIEDNVVSHHNEHMISFLKLYFKKMETEDRKTVIDFMRRFIDKYKARELDVGYYRVFDIKSNFDVIGDDNIYMEWWNEEKDSLNISYNFFNILLQLIKIPL